MSVLRPLWLVVALAGCGARTLPVAAEPLAEAPAPVPKNVILVIVDGMGPQQLGFWELYARRAPSRPVGERPTTFARLAELGEVGLSMHYPADQMVVDSACSATQLATGVPALSETVGIDMSGNPVPTVLERARDAGKATGLVSDTRITHATPAAFAAHVAHRDLEAEIAAQLVASRTDVLLSGGVRYFVPQSTPGSKRKDDRDLLAEAKKGGYSVVQERAALATAGDRVLGLFAPSAMMDALQERRTRTDAGRTEPTLAEMAEAALGRLSKDPDGFFLMLECGQVDWAGHANDAGWLLAEMRRCDEALEELLSFTEARTDTLLVVTADHETGGFGLSYHHADVPTFPNPPGSAFANHPYKPDNNFGALSKLDQIAAQKMSYEDLLGSALQDPSSLTPAELSRRVTENGAFPLSLAQAERVLRVPRAQYTAIEAYYPEDAWGIGGAVARELSSAQNVVWSTGSHTHTPVPVLAFGPGASAFDKIQHHTDIGQALVRTVVDR